MYKTLATILNSRQSSTRSKSTPETAARTKNASLQDAPPTSHKEIHEDEESPFDIIREIVKEKLAAPEKTTTKD